MTQKQLQIGIAGNCQVMAMQAWLSKNIPDARLFTLQPYHMIKDEKEVIRWIHKCSDADAVLAMPLRDGYNSIKCLGNTSFRAVFQKKLFFYPNLYSDAFFPFFGYAKSVANTTITSDQCPGNPHGDYHDFLAMAIASSCMPWGRLMRFRLSLASKRRKTLDNNARHSVCELKNRLAAMGSSLNADTIDLGDFCGFTFNHPSARLLNKLYLSIWTKILGGSTPDFVPLQSEPFAESTILPIPEFVHDAILGTHTGSHSRAVTSMPEYEEEIKRCLAYYKKNEWIIKANLKHAKFIRAKKYLRFLSWV